MTETDSAAVADVDRRLVRLTRWMEHFGLDASRVKIIRDGLEDIVASGEGFWVADREQQLGVN